MNSEKRHSKYGSSWASARLFVFCNRAYLSGQLTIFLASNSTTAQFVDRSWLNGNRDELLLAWFPSRDFTINASGLSPIQQNPTVILHLLSIKHSPIRLYDLINTPSSKNMVTRGQMVHTTKTQRQQSITEPPPPTLPPTRSHRQHTEVTGFHRARIPGRSSIRSQMYSIRNPGVPTRGLHVYILRHFPKAGWFLVLFFLLFVHDQRVDFYPRCTNESHRSWIKG